MALDDQTRAFIDAATAKATPPPGTMPLGDFRAAVEGFRALGFEREEVAVVRDVTIGDTRARAYVPDVDGTPPVVVWAHGGSWVRVTVDLLDGHFRRYANRSGCAVVAVDYGLAPESQFPRAIEEVLEVARWAREQDLWDGSRLGVAGESSGGNLAAAAARLDRDRGDAGFTHQALVVPVLDVRFDTPSWRDLGADYLLTAAQLKWAVEQYAPGVSPEDPLLSPGSAGDLVGLPPALIVTGEYDPLRDEGERYAQRLQAAGVPVEHVHYDGLIHHALMAPARIDLGARMLDETAAAIGRALRAPVGLS
jgi:acetyl esterase/lipase